MKSMHFRWSAVQWAVMAGLAGTLAGCGGGGGDGGPEPLPPPTLALTAANQETVSHDTAAGVMALSATASMPLAAGVSVGASPRSAALSLPAALSARILGYALRPMQAQAAASVDGRERALALIGPMDEQCSVSGTWTLTFDDRDGNNNLSAGDVATAVFNNCVDTPGETTNGTAVVSFTQFADSNNFSARQTLTAMSDVTVKHSLTLDGSMLLVSSTSGSVINYKATADGSVTAAISTHLPFTDTVTLQDGFVIEDRDDTSLAQTTTKISGRMQSNAANGSFDVSTLADAPITQNYADEYPHSGVLKLTGKTGTVTLTALSASQVKIDLDADDNGTIDSTQTQLWDWLL